MLNKGRFFSRIGDWKSAHVEFDKIIAKEKAGSGRKIDASFEKLKIFLFNSVSLCNFWDRLIYIYLVYNRISTS